MPFLSIQVLKKNIAFPFNMQFITFLFNYLFNSELFLICFFLFFLMKSSNNIFTVKMTNKWCPRHSAFNSRNHKIFFRPIWSVSFCKDVFILWYSYMITNFKVKIFLVIFFSKLIYVLDFPSTGVILIICTVAFIH